MPLFLARVWRQFSRRPNAGLQSAHGVGLRPYRKPAGGDTHAREPASLHDHPAHLP